MVWSLGRPLTRSNLSPTLMPALSPGPLGMTPLATRKPECSFHQTPSVGVVYWDSFCQLMTANTTLAAVSNASTTAEKRTNESFRIRCFPNLSTPGLRPEDEGVELDRSNWDAIWFLGGGAKLCVCLDLQNYKCFSMGKLLKLVFRCGFLYFQFMGGIGTQRGTKSLKIAGLSWKSPAFRSERGDNIVFECPKRKSDCPQRPCRSRNFRQRLMESKSTTLALGQGVHFCCCMDCWADRSAGGETWSRCLNTTRSLLSICRAMVKTMP